MSLKELNSEIRRLGNIANSRLRTLKRHQGEKDIYDSSIDFLQKLAGQANPEKSGITGMAKSFSTAKAKSVNAGRKSLSVIVTALESKRSTLQGLTKIDAQRKKTFEDKYLKQQRHEKRKVRVYDDNGKYHYEEKDVLVKNTLTWEEYHELVKLLSESNSSSAFDSNQAMDIFMSELSGDKKFNSYDEMKNFLEDTGAKSIPQMEYDKLAPKSKYDEKTRKWVKQ